MSLTVHAIYGNGVFRPVGPVDLPEHTLVQFEPRIPAEAPESPKMLMSEGLANIHEILGRRYSC